MALDTENAALKEQLNWIPENAPSYVTGRVVADTGGLYARAVLLTMASGTTIRPGEIVLDGAGLAGRVTELGDHSARILLITDLNSRVPVMLERNHVHALMIGTNGARPRVIYWPEGESPVEGDRIVTGSEAGAFPAGLPVGIVHYAGGTNVPEVETFARLDRLENVRVFDYGTGAPTRSSSKQP